MFVLLWLGMLIVFGVAGFVYSGYMALLPSQDIGKYLEAPKKDKVLRLSGVGGQTTSVGIRPTEYETEIM